MKAVILNSGIGKRMGGLTDDKPKCMAQIGMGFTILSWQLHLLAKACVHEVVITTGPFADILQNYVQSLSTKLNVQFVANPDYASTNYIYSIDCAREHLEDDCLLLHGDLVFEPSVLDDLLNSSESCVTVDSLLPLPEKDFKAKISGNRVQKVGIEFFGKDCVACQPIYHMYKQDMMIWLDEIERFCVSERRNVYAENALNEVLDQLALYTLELNGRLCNEIDNEDDLNIISSRFKSCIESERIII